MAGDRAGDTASATIEEIYSGLNRLREQLERSPAVRGALRPTASTRAEAAAREVRRRNQQLQAFGSKLVSNPGWDMLIDLFLARERGKSISVSSLCIASNVPQTTALRWISTLEEEGLICRIRDPNDRRRAYLELTASGAHQVAECIAGSCD